MNTSSILYKDLINIAENIPAAFYNKTIFVTGGTGLIGSLIIKGIITSNEINNSNIKVVSIVRDFDKASNIFEGFKTDNIKFITGDIVNKIDFDGNIDYIIHGASPTASKFFVTYPVETISTAVNGTKNLLDFAKDKNVKGFVYLSSMEAFGQLNDPNKRVSENQLGYIDITNTRSCYSESKRMCECLCACYAAEYNLPIKVARLAQVFGAGILKNENRVFAQFARSVINKESIVLHTDGTSWGNYCYTSDAIKGIFTVLEKGSSGETYTVVNEVTSMQIKDIAKMLVEQLANNEIKLIFDIPEDAQKFGYAPATVLKLSSKKLNQLGWFPTVDLLEAYKRLIIYLQED